MSYPVLIGFYIFKIMESNELMIGNFVLYNLYNGEKVLWKIDFMDFHPQTTMEYSPIPFTIDWLNKIEGIKESTFHNANETTKGWYLNEDVVIIILDGKFYCYEITDGESWGYEGNEINFVHELQNYFYWYNNQKKELTFKT